MNLKLKIIISNNLMLICDKENKNKKEFANYIGFSYKSFNSYANGTSLPKANFFHAMNKAGFNLVWLLTGEGEMYQSKSDNNFIEPIFPSTNSVSTQEELIKNHRKAKITAFVEHWFATKSMDEQAWFEVQLGHSFPQYSDFLNNEPKPFHSS